MNQLRCDASPHPTAPLQLVSNEPEITDSSSRNAVSLSSARITKRFSAWIALCHIETVQQTARDQELHGDLTWRGGHESARCSSNRLSAPVECSQFVAKEFQLRARHFVTQKMHTYEICSCKDKCGFDLISDALPFGRLWYGEPNAVSNAIGYTKFRSRSHDAVIRVYDKCRSRRGSTDC
jgi:hypothetical protein